MEEADVDINNNGDFERVVRISFHNKRFNSEVVLKFVVDRYHNLNPKFYKFENFACVLGEIFKFDGRTFSLLLTDEYSVNEHFDDPMMEYGGLHVRYGICRLTE